MTEEETDKELLEISEDNTSGSVSLVFKTLDLLSKRLVEIQDGHLKSNDFDFYLNELVRKLKNAQPTMSAIENIASRVARYRDLVASEPTSDKITDLLSYISKLKDKLSQDGTKIASHLETLAGLGSRIITISSSSTVNQVISYLHLHNKVTEVIVPESRPRLEGRTTAKLLSEMNVSVTLIVDAGIRLFCDKCDFGLIGADSILNDGSVVNKIGSRILALSCKDAGIPLYVVAESLKFRNDYSQTNPPLITEKPTMEVADQGDVMSVKIRNIYFEVVPANLITKIITENGIFFPDLISKSEWNVEV